MKTLSIIGLLIFASLKSAAQEKDITVDYVTENLQHKYEMIDDANVQFEQHMKFGFSSIEQTFSGTLLMKKPNHYRIETQNQTIVTDGTTVWVYSKTHNQVIIDKYKENTNSLSPEKFMLSIPSNYHTSITETDKTSAGTIIQLKLVPKDDRSFVKYVRLTVEEHGWLVRKITIMDINETETTYTVKEIKLNANIKEKAFIFEKPEGAEVVDLR